MENGNITQIDVLLITAVKDELDVILDSEPDWQPDKDSKNFPYYIRKDIDNTGNEFSIAVARPVDMGGDFASNLATRLINELKPFCLAMAGICAGWRGKVNLGDIIIAERVFRYDNGKLKAFLEGKEKKEDVFHDIRTYNLKPLWVQKAQDFPSDWIKKIKITRPKSYNHQELWLLYKLDEFESNSQENKLNLDKEEREKNCHEWKEVLERLENKKLIKIDEELKLTDEGKRFISQVKIRNPDGCPKDPETPESHVAPMGTGSKVVEDPELFPTISHYMRKVLAVEMEAAAIGTVAEIENVESCIIVKGVSDYGDHDKSDHFRKYAVEGSYRFLIEFLKENLQKKRKYAPFILPQLTPSFINRENELNLLEQLILISKTKSYSFVGITGPPGIGKSALACHFAELHKNDFVDGVIGLRVDGKDVDTIAREFSRSCGIEITSNDKRDANTIMQEIFHHRTMLLIFDNATDSSIRSLFPGGNRCAVIVTTRDRGLPISLDFPYQNRIDLEPLNDKNALLFLEQYTGEDFKVSEIDSVKKVIELIGNLPLALKIVSAMLQIQKGRSFTDYAKSLNEQISNLKTLEYRGDKNLDLKASFLLSLEMLKSEEKDFFACLSVCAKDGFTVHTAMIATGSDKGTAEETLFYLYRLSLIDQPEANLFSFHPLIQRFAHEIAIERSLLEIAAERHAKYYERLLRNIDLNDPYNMGYAIEELKEILIAVDWLQQHNKIDYELAVKLESFLQNQGLWYRASELMAGFLESPEKIEDKFALELINNHQEGKQNE